MLEVIVTPVKWGQRVKRQVSRLSLTAEEKKHSVQGNKVAMAVW